VAALARANGNIVKASEMLGVSRPTLYDLMNRLAIKSAKEYLAKNDGRAAVIQLKSSLQKDPNSAEARYLLGKALLDSGDAPGAGIELGKALDLGYPPSSVVPPLARALIVQGQAKKVIDDYAQTTLPDAQAQADLKTSVATAYGMQGEAEKAASAVSMALDASPDYAPALRFQARLRADAKEFDAAFALLDRVLAQNPNDHEALHLQGELMAYARKDAAAAVDSFRKALAAKSNYVPSSNRLIVLLLSRGETAAAKEQLEVMRKQMPNQPQTVYLEALVAVAERDFKVAREKAQSLVQIAPNNLNVLQLAGSIELQLNSLLTAESHLNKVLAAAPGQVVTRRQLAQIAIRQGQPDKALTLLQPILDKPTSEAADYGLAAEAHLMAGDAKKAEEYFARTAKLDPKDVKSRTALALSRMQSGDAAVALEDLQAIAAEDSGAFADLALVAAHIRRKEFDAALTALDALEKKQPDRPLASVLRARVHLLRNDAPAARASFGRAQQIDPKNFPAAAGLAAMDLTDNKPGDARKRFEDLLTLEPKNTQALVALASLRARAGASKEEIATLLGNAVTANPTEAGPRLLLVNHHLANKDYKLAQSAAQNAVAALPNDAELLDALGRAQALSGDTEQAATSFNKLATMQPASPVPHLRLAEMHANAKNLDAASQSLRKALEIKPDLLQAQRALIQVEVASNRHQAAITVARTVQAQRPSEPIGYLMQADVEVSRKDWAAAETALRTGLKAAPDATELAARLHTVLLAADKKADADRFAADWPKTHPKDIRFVMYLGDRALGQRDLAEAESRYRAVLKMQPDNPLALNNVAWLMASQKRPGALPMAQRAAELLPNSPAVLDTLALALAEDNQMPKALETMRKAVALQPENHGLRLNLAQMHLRAGDRAAAKTELDELAKLGDKFAGQAKVTELLATL
jgi:cellulose synthase operon protein C